MLFFICSSSELDVMVSLENSSSNGSRVAPLRSFFLSSSSSNTRVQRSIGRSMRTIRSNFLNEQSPSFASFPAEKASISEALSEAAIDLRLGELVRQSNKPEKLSATEEELLDISQTFSHFSACSSDISGELQRLASLPHGNPSSDQEPEPHLGFLTEMIENIPPEDLEPSIKLCIKTLESSSIAAKQSAAAKLRFLAKNRTENRALIGDCGAIPALIPLLRSGDPCLQEHTVTALLNLSLHDENKAIISRAGAIKPLIYVVKTGTETSKQNAACALLSLALVEENKASIGACGAIPPLISLLMNGSSRGKKDALTTMYKLCSIKVNKERAVSAGAVKPLVDLVPRHGSGLAEKAMVVLSCLASIPEGKVAMVEEGGVAALVEAVEDGSVKGKEFAVVTLLQLCGDSFGNRALLVREGGVPPLVSLSQTGSARAKHKAETLLGYLRELRHEASSSLCDRFAQVADV